MMLQSDDLPFRAEENSKRFFDLVVRIICGATVLTTIIILVGYGVFYLSQVPVIACMMGCNIRKHSEKL